MPEYVYAGNEWYVCLGEKTELCWCCKLFVNVLHSGKSSNKQPREERCQWWEGGWCVLTL